MASDTWTEQGFDHRMVQTNGVDLHVAEAGEGPLVVFCHGFPGLWYSWRRQLGFVAAAGWHGAAIDMRGFGRTRAPADISAHTPVHAAADLVGLLDALGEEQAVFVGQDFGAGVVWTAAMLYPERVRAVVAGVPLVSQYQQAEMFDTAPLGREMFLHVNYFQDVGPADKELDSDPHKFLRCVYYMLSGDAPPRGYLRYRYYPLEGTGYLDVLSEPPAVMEWLSPADLEYFATEYERTGFTGGLNWYRANMAAAAKDSVGESQLEPTVDVPALFITGERDPVLDMVSAAALASMRERVPDLRGTLLVPGAGHFVQQERYAEYDDALLRFLGSVR